jgi:NAD(P)-dependent dehydrogenase (short-subunit alcohol dehydrogenase family)
VTGASAGFGRTVTEHALQQGDNVVATLRKPEALSDLLSTYSSRLLVLPLDVRDPEQIRVAFENAVQRFGRVDIVFNNAGICIISEAEGMSDEHGRELFEVLFWGAANVTKEAVKVFRERNDPPGGRLLQVSSRTTLKIEAGIAHYAAAYVVIR